MPTTLLVPNGTTRTAPGKTPSREKTSDRKRKAAHHFARRVQRRLSAWLCIGLRWVHKLGRLPRRNERHAYHRVVGAQSSAKSPRRCGGDFLGIAKETKLTNEKISLAESSIPQFHPPARLDRTAQGVAVWVREDVAHEHLSTLDSQQLLAAQRYSGNRSCTL